MKAGGDAFRSCSHGRSSVLLIGSSQAPDPCLWKPPPGALRPPTSRLPSSWPPLAPQQQEIRLDTRRPPTAAAVVFGSSPGCDFPLLPPASLEVEPDQMCPTGQRRRHCSRHRARCKVSCSSGSSLHLPLSCGRSICLSSSAPVDTCTQTEKGPLADVVQAVCAGRAGE